MPHYKHSVTIVVVGVGGVVGEFSTLLFATLCLVVAKLATISALGGVILTTQSGMIAPLLLDAPPHEFATSCR